MALLSPLGPQFFKNDGTVAAGCRLYTFLSGTTTQQNAFTSQAGSTPHTYVSDGAGGTYIALDTAGKVQPALWLTAGVEYRIRLNDSTGALIDEWDDISGIFTAPVDSTDVLYARTAGEIAAGVTPTNYQYLPGDIRRYGAVADGNYSTGAGTDNTAAIQRAISVMATSGGGVITIPGGIPGQAFSSFKVSSQITIPDGVTVQGAGKWSSILFCPNAFSNTGGLVRVSGATGNPTGLRGVGVISQTGGCSGYGIVSVKNGTFISDVWVSGFNVGVNINQTDNFLDDFAIELCTTNLYIQQSDVNVSHGTVYQGAQGVLIANSGAVGSGRVHLTAVRATQQQQLGFIVSGGKNVTLTGCSASADTNVNFYINAAVLVDTSTDVVIDGFAGKIGGGTASTTGFGIKLVSSFNINASAYELTGFLDGINGSSCTAVAIGSGLAKSNGRYGINFDGGDQISITGANCSNNGTGAAGDCGIRANNSSANSVHTIVGCTCVQSGGGPQEYGINVGVSGSNSYSLAVGNTALFNNTADINLSGTTANIRCDKNIAGTINDTPPSVASASNIAVPLGCDTVVVTGTTTITSITAAGCARRTVTLNFSGALTVTDGSNLKLAGNFVTTADDTLTLYCDGTNWIEVARSVN